MSDKNYLLYNSFNGARVWTSPAIMQRLRRGSNPIEGLKLSFSIGLKRFLA